MNRLGNCEKLNHRPARHDGRVSPTVEPGLDMPQEDEWDAIRGRKRPLLGAAGIGMLRISLLFGSGAAALALILAPLADRYSRLEAGDIDYTTTGSIGERGAYTIRRSVLQKADAVCIIRSDGRRSGDC
jgi:hypothetical protein